MLSFDASDIRRFVIFTRCLFGLRPTGSRTGATCAKPIFLEFPDFEKQGGQKLRFLGVSSKSATFSKGYLGGFLGDLKESIGAMGPQAPISRRICHFLSRLFADQLFNPPADEGLGVGLFCTSLFIFFTFFVFGSPRHRRDRAEETDTERGRLVRPRFNCRFRQLIRAYSSKPFVNVVSCRSCPKCGRMPQLRNIHAKSFANKHLPRSPSKFFGQQISKISHFFWSTARLAPPDGSNQLAVAFCRIRGNSGKMPLLLMPLRGRSRPRLRRYKTKKACRRMIRSIRRQALLDT
jgi:hypothetical protein